jgi:hypothetical protein
MDQIRADSRPFYSTPTIFGIYIVLSLPLSSLSLLSSSAKALTPLLTSLYCSTISLGCSRTSSSSSPPPTLHIGRVARSLTDEASRASDIFASVVELSSLQGLGLHQTEIWELAMTVKRGSSLDNKEILAGELTELVSFFPALRLFIPFIVLRKKNKSG